MPNPEAATGAGVNTVGDSADHASRPRPTRNGEPLRVYEPLIDTGQAMDEGGARMYGSRPHAE